MGERAKIIDDFLAAAGWAGMSRELLAGDASNRSYDRVYNAKTNTSVVLMDAPPATGEDVRSFVAVTEMLRGRGLNAPEILSADPKAGLLLIEDLGDALFARVCNDFQEIEVEMYQAAVDILIHLHQFDAPDDLPLYDNPAYWREAKLLTDWYLPGVTSQPPVAVVISNYEMLITTACDQIDHGNRVLVQRDYHAENLLWLPDRQGLHRVGLLDYQDALAGHAAYDLMSLLEDARKDTSEELQSSMKARYLAATNMDCDAFELAYCTLGAQRNLKIIGIFARLCLRDGKFTYLDYIPRVWAHLQRDLSHPSLSHLKEWVDQNIPPPLPENLQRIREKCHVT